MLDLGGEGKYFIEIGEVGGIVVYVAYVN